MLILYFYIFQRVFAVLNATFQASVYVTIVTNIVYYIMYHYQKSFRYLISSSIVNPSCPGGAHCARGGQSSDYWGLTNKAMNLKL